MGLADFFGTSKCRFVFKIKCMAWECSYKTSPSAQFERSRGVAESMMWRTTRASQST